MYACVCNGITNEDLHQHFNRGVETVGGLQAKTGFGNCCETCIPEIEETIGMWIKAQAKKTINLDIFVIQSS